MDNFAPRQFGKHLWICPSWQSPPDPDAVNILLDPGLAENARRAEAWASTDLFQAMDGRVRLGAHMARFFQGYDMLLTPTLPLEAFAVNHQVPPDSDMHDWQEWANFSYPFNLTGQPGVSVPCGFSTNGLPISFQLTAERYQDVAIMQAARAYMDAHPPTHPDVPGADPAI